MIEWTYYRAEDKHAAICRRSQ